jgi:2-polyprenyl-6-methoxyphenol hydroxylase-like FAD-dependent oxidoreductase
MMLAAELALAKVDVAIVERRTTQDLDGSRARHARAHHRGARPARSGGSLPVGAQTAQIGSFAGVRLDISDFPTRHNYGLALAQAQFEEILAGWVEELGVPMYRGREVTGFAQSDAGVGAYVDVIP